MYYYDYRDPRWLGEGPTTSGIFTDLPYETSIYDQNVTLPYHV